MWKGEASWHVMDFDKLDPCLINPLPLIEIIIGIPVFRPLKGGGPLIRCLHYP